MFQLLPKDCVIVTNDKKPTLAFEYERTGMLNELHRKRKGL